MKLLDEIIDVILSTTGGDIKRDMLIEDFKLVGNILDSMAVTNLILALEDRFGFMFSDDELSAEAFETVGTLAELVRSKLQ
ncbi:MAG TPA: acyl carrier protein [Deltaproteobacteria bacterium]|jgi:acyl carrier protein|nr:acyl carrier protein [Deltaproteobacteria bacterium]